MGNKYEGEKYEATL